MVIFAAGVHPAPSRTRQLSPPAPMVLEGRPSGRVGHCQEGFFYFVLIVDILLVLCYNNLHKFEIFPQKIPVNPNIFREFSIRGVADQDLTADVLVAIGWAISIFFRQHDIDTIVLGRDVRNSSPQVSASICQGCLQAGAQVIDVGLVPTPVLNFATDYYQAQSGIMITASHNPPEFNGLKIRSERTLNGAELQKIYQIALTYQADQMGKGREAQASVKQLNPIPIYLERVKAAAARQDFTIDDRPLKVVVDGGHGTNGEIVADLLRDLTLDVVELFCKADGNFPGRGPDPTSVTALNQLGELVRSEKADLGLAYDGDGDRLAVVDEQGRHILGDQIIMILARDILRLGPAKIVYEILCTQALADDIVAHGGEPIMTPSGYAFVHEILQRENGALGGEFSGHLFFNEPDFRFDDAILATLKLLGVIVDQKRSLSTLAADLPRYHSSPQIRVPCPDKTKRQVVARVRQKFEKDYKLDTLDGVRIHFDEGWAIVRQSNTQPVISMRFEARTLAHLEVIQHRVYTFVEKEINRQVNITL